MGLLASLAGIRSIRTTTTRERINGKSRYRGVQVNGIRADCCAAVQAVAGQRFLSDEVPMLPLGGCDANDCRCTYELFDDRRTDIRRASDETFDIASQLREQDNRSSTASRRRSDH